MNVTDIPIWDDCPFREAVPSDIEVRRGDDSAGHPLVVFWWPDGSKHVAMRTEKVSEVEESIPSILRNMGYVAAPTPEDEIEITPEMIEAGSAAICQLFEPTSEVMAYACYMAMEAVRRSHEIGDEHDYNDYNYEDED